LDIDVFLSLPKMGPKQVRPPTAPAPRSQVLPPLTAKIK
jgi:hypothetical protein